MNESKHQGYIIRQINYLCLLFKYLDTESLLSDIPKEKNIMDDLSTKRLERITRIPCLRYYYSLSPQHPIHFLLLCAQVFFYYLVYGYLQVRLKKKF
jgi:hypothetical protein